jgi:ribonuclease P protein component
VAFAIGRAIGSSVVRNRVRRRLRAALSTPAAHPAPQLPPGWYLIGARPDIAALSSAQLISEVSDLVAAVERQLARPQAGSSAS